MARKPKAVNPSPSPEPSEEETLTDLPAAVDPYTVLSIDKTATADQVKSAYRKAALKYHPDKATAETQEEAKKKFQEVAFAYAILSDDKRRKRYDATGNTAESLDDDDFDWVDFFREQTAAMVNGNMIEQIKREYQGSEEEREDVLRVYEDNEGDMDAVYEEVMCSNVLDDDSRFRGYIDKAIKAGNVKSYSRYAKETKEKRRARVTKAKGEAQEAMALAEDLGVKEKLFGAPKGKSGKKSGADDDALKALIQSRQKDRSTTFLDSLEAKYGGGKSKSKRTMEEPPEELFAQNAKKSKGKKA